MGLRGVLAAAVARGASDIHVRAGSPLLVRVDGALGPLLAEPLSDDGARALVMEALPTWGDGQAEQDFAVTVEGVGRFRANAYLSRGVPAMVLRYVRSDIPRLDDLGLPAVLRDFALLSDGLVLVCGPTGSGKSTTLAAMVDAINDARTCHVLTIEDPIEFLHQDRVASISQREVHTDTLDFLDALRAGLRQDPDVIVIGEVRDLATLRTALQAAETGHLVLASMHARSVQDAVSRIMDLYPSDEQRQARTALSEALRAVVCQRLVPSATGRGLQVVTEVAVATERLRGALLDPDKLQIINDIVTEGEFYGMHSFEQDAIRLVLAGRVTVSEAEKVVPNAADLHVALRRAGFRDVTL